jgi:LmbE family N-acetylglucosaminyl deacetylase
MSIQADKDAQDKLSILFVGGHPHDVIAQAGGTLALHIRNGDRVTAALLTHGGATHTVVYQNDVATGLRPLSQETLDEETAAMQQQIRDAAAVLGITDVRFLRTQDDIVLVERPLIRSVEQVIREVRPDFIITHHPLAESGIAFTHATCAQVVMHAMVTSMSLQPDNPLPEHDVAQVFFITPPQQTTLLDSAIPRAPVIFVDVTEVIHLKVLAEEKIKAQYRSGCKARKVHEVMEGYWGGKQTGIVPYCEVFTPYFPEIYRLLPLSDYLRDRAAPSMRAKVAERWSQMIPPYMDLGEG